MAENKFAEGIMNLALAAAGIAVAAATLTLEGLERLRTRLKIAPDRFERRQGPETRDDAALSHATHNVSTTDRSSRPHEA